MEIDGPLIDGVFVRRVSRFSAQVEVGGCEQLVHVPNSGRLGELLRPGARVMLAARSGRGQRVLRKSCFDLLMAWSGTSLVSIDARLPPRLLEVGLRDGRVPGLEGVSIVRREVRYGDSRLDLLGEGSDGAWLIETKSVTLVSDGVALFPDAPTQRGTRHLLELARAVEAGYRAAVVFVVQREDATSFSPHVEADPVFALTLAAIAASVRIVACRCSVTTEEASITRAITVKL